MVDYTRLQATADRLIKKFGSNAVLRHKTLGDRPCFAVITEYTPHERSGKLINPTDRKALVSAVGLSLAPDNEQDKLVTFVASTTTVDEVLRIVAPPTKLSPAGTVVYWELQVRR